MNSMKVDGGRGEGKRRGRGGKGGLRAGLWKGKGWMDGLRKERKKG